MCYKYTNIINIKKNNKTEKYIIFSSKFQMNLLKKESQIFIDGTFKISPIGYYQIINIAGFIPNINKIVPIFLYPQQGKMNTYIIIYLEMLKIF